MSTLVIHFQAFNPKKSDIQSNMLTILKIVCNLMKIVDNFSLGLKKTIE